MAYYSIYDPTTEKDIDVYMAHEITAHTAAKIPGFSGDVRLTRESPLWLRVERGVVVHSWNEALNLPRAIYEPCKYGGLDRVYRIKLSTLLRSSRYSFH